VAVLVQVKRHDVSFEDSIDFLAEAFGRALKYLVQICAHAGVRGPSDGGVGSDQSQRLMLGFDEREQLVVGQAPSGVWHHHLRFEGERDGLECLVTYVGLKLKDTVSERPVVDDLGP
jgi:hypothetical protein